MTRLRTLLSPALITGGVPYFDYQARVARDAVLPWLAARMPLEGIAVGDFGAHQGGALHALREDGRVRSAVGIELNARVVDTSPFVGGKGFTLDVGDLTSLACDGEFDLVLLHDVLEHVVDRDAVLTAAERSLADRGRLFVSFPPYYAAFGGHQHLARGVARIVPFAHYLPERLFLRVAAPDDNEYMSAADSFDDMVSVRGTRLTLRKAERNFASAGLRVLARDLFLLRPEHSIRYGVRTIRASVLGRVPGVREVAVNGAYYLLARS